MPRGPEETPITNQEMAFAHLVMAGTLTDREAAQRAGIDPERAAYTKGKPRVKAYMEQHQASVASAMVQKEVEALSEFNITRRQIIAKYWEFTNVDPKETRGSLVAQVRALDSLRDMLGFGSGRNPEDLPIPPDVYQAEWLREPRQN